MHVFHTSQRRMALGTLQKPHSSNTTVQPIADIILTIRHKKSFRRRETSMLDNLEILLYISCDVKEYKACQLFQLPPIQGRQYRKQLLFLHMHIFILNIPHTKGFSHLTPATLQVQKYHLKRTSKRAPQSMCSLKQVTDRRSDFCEN